ncbi:MAG TPA: hypothetical protein VKX45_26520 [Bryobacteraceae bacterium]|nr:hypothetical protein [Bryobacteraceae bacterium]
MKGWSAAWVALALGAAPAAWAAADLNSAARDLARRTAAFAGHGEAVAIAWRDLSSLGPAALGQARGCFEASLRESGIRTPEAVSPVEAQITLSENASQYLLIEEIRRGDERQVWIAGWSRGAVPASAAVAAAVTLQSRLLWEQEQQILDVAVDGDSLSVLSPTSVAVYQRTTGGWQPRVKHAIAWGKPWPRDLRGRLQVANGRLRAWLPGAACQDQGGILPAGLECRPSDEPWTIDSGRALLLAHFAAGRNYFDGRVVTQSGATRNVPPFYSAAAFDDAGRTVWLLALADGSAGLFDASLDPLGAASGSWGSDVAAAGVRCGGRSLVLASRAGDGRQADALRAWALSDRAVAPISDPLELPGPITALWPAPGGATAVVQNAAAGRYQAYSVTVACGQ